ncbi:hypothetical protein CO051_02715 [Candidatus Roizmanbacteria bacterium CG_4_9_14_0_2_um_filter_39_13]|uniref:Carbohydrate kinase PfkB domain-containing protein n=2 Tax=Candidatus Roizmaniibacteriota TaxID=1752723 RepID=A0A2M8F079_9BACT|nr:MAG: hypothetical protein COY15_06045 [Candidatus Roizmanbacteria bacterium CG_4_10_14_0_2_um_filter_39_12]PJC32694.1 MAG: hypothetical protein CO051_02715 [Candidatus Roizmanbacteria bacterium CG_4_9_14_0_2_um_filter_39_13]PJE61803.1 MAG: hypothetical protein COU87_02650 [Candidatus Roizmanbacteria bacterium CG10_big_fil_rev_8_21_14_0_10_39_12]
MTKPTYSAIGDIGLDIYPNIGKHFPGGMALNSAYHAQRLGAISSVVSAIGDDINGKELIEFLDLSYISIEGLEIIHGKTDSVKITLDEYARPQYGTWNLGVLEKFRLTSAQKQYLQTQDIAVAVHLPELRSMFNDFAKLHLSNTLKVGDFTDLSEYGGNQEILKEYKNSFDIFALSIDEKVDTRLNTFQSFINKEKKIGIALLGERGSAVFPHGKKYVYPAEKVSVVDTTGAGDAYLATFLVEYYHDQDISSAMGKATQKASIVIQTYGAVA